MKTQLNITLLAGILTGGIVILSSFQVPFHPHSLSKNREPGDALKSEAFAILDAKCNVCHRKQNPFMVFNEKNIAKRARKIYNAVFVEKRMPKGNAIELTAEENTRLEKWLLTQNIK